MIFVVEVFRLGACWWDSRIVVFFVTLCGRMLPVGCYLSLYSFLRYSC